MSDLDVEEIDQTGDDEVTSLEEGKILDYITGEPVKDTPKEQVRQRIARALFHEYGISVEDMVPDFKMKVDGRKKSIDIAIFEPGADKTPENLRRVVICDKEPKTGSKGAYKMRDHKQAEKEFGLLYAVMGQEDAEGCRWGLWTNGLDFFFFEKETTKFDVKFHPRGDWPMADGTLGSRTVASTAQLRRADRDMLLTAFRRCHNYIHGNEGMPKDAAFWQFLYLIFAKLHDERRPKDQPPRGDEAQVAALRERYGAEPRALEDVLLLVPADKLDERRDEYPGIEVRPLKFAAAELQASHWRFLMGAVGNQATYIRQLNRIMKQLRDDLTLAGLQQGIDASRMPDHIKELARGRLELAEEFIDDETNLGEVIRPGRLVIVDLRDEFMEKDQALGLFVVLLQLFAEVTYEGRKFNKLVVFDEAHKYIESPDLVAGLVEVVREMRHKGTSIMVASQDPPSVPVQLIELSSQIILHKFNSPAWLKHIQKANAALGGLTPEKMAHLRPGEAFVWSSKATDEAFSKGAIKVRCRPRATQHGGATKTAVRD